MKTRFNTARVGLILIATIWFAAEGRADYVLNGGEVLGTFRIREDGSLAGAYTPPPAAQDVVETYGEDAVVTPDLSTVYQFTNSLGYSTSIFAFDVQSHAYLPNKVLHSGFGMLSDDFILNAQLSLIRPIDPLNKGDLFTVSGTSPGTLGGTRQIKRYNRATDSYVETIDPPTPQVIRDFAFGPDNRLYMAAETGIYVYQESAAGFALASPTPLLGTLSGKMTFGPDAHLYLVNPSNLNVERYTTGGVFVDTFANSVGGLSIQFGVDGNLHVLVGGATIKKYDGNTGSLLRTIQFGVEDPLTQFVYPFAVGRITYLPIPEPTSALLAAIGVSIAFLPRRRGNRPS